MIKALTAIVVADGQSLTVTARRLPFDPSKGRREHEVVVHDGVQATRYYIRAGRGGANFSSGLISRTVNRYLLDQIRPADVEPGRPTNTARPTVGFAEP